jgi:glycosyltransferase involved in cell wall biosynthesis
VAFDATHLSRLGAGVSTYILNLIAALSRLEGRSWDLVVLATREQAGVIQSRAGDVDVHPVRIPATAYRLAWEQLGLPRVLAGIGAGLLHSPHYSLPFRLPIPRVVTFHDVTYVTMPERHRSSRRWYFRSIIPRAARVADHVFCISRTTCDDLMALYPDLPPSKLSVVPLGPAVPATRMLTPEELVASRRRLGLHNPFILQVGTLEPRKNVGTAIAAVAALRERRPDVELVLVGQRGWESSDLFETIARSPFVRYLGHVPDDDLAALYRLADLLVVPSHYEGFGLPVVEAMVAGTPVVTSGKGSLAEVAGAAAVVPKGESAEAYAEAMLAILSDDRLRADMVAAGRVQAARFTWERAAMATGEVYERLLGLDARPEVAHLQMSDRR